jgi:hypothetical protein
MNSLAGGTAFAVGVLMCTACEGHSDARTVVNESMDRPLRFAHGLSTGDVIAVQRMPCADGVVRTIGSSERVQLVTFSTTGDCTQCDRHLMGLEQLYRQRILPDEAMIVMYAPPARQVEVLAGFRMRTARPICFDETGALWTVHDISYTPFTALIRNGQVVYLDDAPLETDQDLLAFRDAVRAAQGAAK